MAIETQCPGCRKRYRVKDELAGRKIKCKQCGKPIKVEDPLAMQDDEWAGDYGDDGYGEDPAYAEPARPKKKGSVKKKKKAATKSASSTKAAWKLPVGILGIAGGIGLLVFSIYGISNGIRKSFRALGGAVVMIGFFFNLAFGGED